MSGFGRCAVMTQLPSAVDTGLDPTDGAAAAARVDAASLDQRRLGNEARRSASVYSAPEMLADSSTATDRVDVYSVAALIWFIRVGHDPDSPLAAGISRRGRPAKRTAGPPGFGHPAPSARLSWPQLAEVVSRASDPDLAERPSADELVQDLEALRCGGGRDAGRCAPRSPARPSCMPWLRTGARPAQPPRAAEPQRLGGDSEQHHVVSSLVLR